MRRLGRGFQQQTSGAGSGARRLAAWRAKGLANDTKIAYVRTVRSLLLACYLPLKGHLKALLNSDIVDPMVGSANASRVLKWRAKWPPVL
jgi:hypothetical protein